MTEIKAIKTMADGIQFRSRLEASWHLMFKKLGFSPQYEPEVFEVKDVFGESLGLYSPDFYLPEERMYVEVKALKDEYSNHDKLSMCKAYILGYKYNVAIIQGSPFEYNAVVVEERHKGTPAVMKVHFERDAKIFNHWPYYVVYYPDEEGVRGFVDPLSAEDAGDPIRNIETACAKQAWNETAWNM